MELKAVELFAGVGGFRVGLNNITTFDKNTGRAIENGDWKFVWANQYEPSTKVQHAYDCYCKRFGEDDVSNEDINKVKKEEIPDHSLLVGGFPCQDYSVARSLNGERGIEGKKGVLFWDIKDVILAKNSPFILLENVDRLLKSPANRRGRDFAIMLKTFDELGYDVQWRVINAGEYSMPQKRRRVFIFAYKRDSKYAESLLKFPKGFNQIIFNEVFPTDYKKLEKKDLSVFEDLLKVNNEYNGGKFLETGMMQNGQIINADIIPQVEKLYTLQEILKQSSLIENSNLSQYIVKEEKLEKWKYAKASKKIERESKQGHKYIYSEGSMAFPEKLDEPARTMLTSEGTLNRSSHIVYDEHLGNYRILTEVECELIQMFPPDWTNTMPSRRRYFMMGNALVTGVIHRLEPLLKEIISNE